MWNPDPESDSDPDSDLERERDGLPDFVAARDRVVEELTAFVRVLRRAGAAVPANAGITAARALVEVGFDDEDRARAALRAALVSRKEDVPTFDRLFPEFWRRLTGEEPADPHWRSEQDAVGPEGALAALGADADPERAGRDGEDDPGLDAGGRGSETVRGLGAGRVDPDEAADEHETAVYSAAGRSKPVAVDLRRREDDLGRSLRRLTRAIAGLRGRRWAPAADGTVDARRALRESFGTGGTVLSVPRRRRRRTAVRAALLVDVSQSVLDTIDRDFLVRFLRQVRADWRRARIFFFDTSVREVTDEFDAPTAERALEALDRAEAEWGGGTRIGRAIETIRREAPDAVDRDTVAFVISDGLEVGEIDRLEEGMVWLSGRAAAVLWLNPLAGAPDYRPTCRGMATALPYVDGLFAFSGPDDLVEIARQLELHDLGRVGYEHDPRRRDRPRRRARGDHGRTDAT